MSKTNIKMEKPEYHVNPDAGVIVCTIKACGDIDNYPDIFLGNSLMQKIRNKYHMHWINEWRSFKAVARLSKGDKWDETTGKRIAESKCKRKIYEFYYRVYINIFNEIVDKNIKVLNRYIDNLDYCAKRETKHLEKLMK